MVTGRSASSSTTSLREKTPWLGSLATRSSDTR